MRVVIACHTDYANYGYEVGEALKSVGVDAQSYCLNGHSFAYAKQSLKTSSRDIRIQCERADLIIAMHSCGTTWDIIKKMNKRIIVFHTGSRYRWNPEKHNARWNPIVEKSVIALGEFESLGAKNPEYFGITINTDKYDPDYTVHSPIIFSHYPSNEDVKGTKNILSVISNLKKKYKFEFKYSKRKVAHELQLNRMNQCDVYIEMCETINGGKPYGSFGTTSVEAAAMGKIVVTNNLWEKLYNKTYGSSMLKIANSPFELQKVLENILQMTPNEILQEKVLTRQWVENKHSHIAHGNKLTEILELK